MCEKFETGEIAGEIGVGELVCATEEPVKVDLR